MISHGQQSGLGPREEPINDRVGYQTGEVAAAPSEGLSGGTHAEHNVQIVAALAHEVVPAVVR